MKTLAKTLSIVGFIGAAALSGVTSAAAADQANWQVGCAPGFACMWQNGINSSPALASTTRDSIFVNDFYANGVQLGDNVRNISNRFSTTSIRAYFDPNYIAPQGSSCIAAGIARGPFVVAPSNGISSFKGC
jgi:hypothetical protein